VNLHKRWSTVLIRNTGFTVKESDEIWASIRIWEIANRIPTLRHFVFSSIDYYLKVSLVFDGKDNAG
jgi:hypothetical protein